MKEICKDCQEYNKRLEEMDLKDSTHSSTVSSVEGVELCYQCGEEIKKITL